MAGCRVEGLDELIQQMAEYEGNIDEVLEDMVELGASEVKEAWKKSAEKHGHKDTGELIESIDYDKRSKKEADGLARYIYPRGQQRNIHVNGKVYGRKKPIRRAAIAFYLHYGHGGTPGSHWVDDADEIADQTAPKKLEERWEEFIKNGR